MAEESGEPKSKAKGPALAPMDFSVLVLSLRTSAMMHLGKAEDEDGGTPPIDLALAKQSMELLGILETKTHGNLTGDEERLLSQVLFDLREVYAGVAKKAQDGG